MQRVFLVPRLQLFKLLGQRGVGREDGGAVGGAVEDVDDVFAGEAVGGVAVFGQEGGDGGAGAVDVHGLELAGGVFVLGVDDEEGGVVDGGGGGGGADEGAEGLGHLE